jgi:hypothetical protein
MSEEQLLYHPVLDFEIFKPFRGIFKGFFCRLNGMFFFF